MPRFKAVIKKHEEHLGINDLGSWLHHQYVEESQSYRKIMKKLDTKSNRTIKKLMDYYEIPIKSRSEAIATQWIDNDKRRRKQGLESTERLKGNTNRRSTDAEIAKEYALDHKRFIKREIIDSYSYVTYECTMCNRLNTQTLGNKSKGCPECSLTVSKGEKDITKVLRGYKIEYQAEYTDTRCRNKHPLPFDFAIFNHGEITALIEYQGKQHYKPVDFFGGKEQFEVQQRHDAIKREFCKSERIPLIVIPYTVENTGEYLKSKLDEIGHLQLKLI